VHGINDHWLINLVLLLSFVGLELGLLFLRQSQISYHSFKLPNSRHTTAQFKVSDELLLHLDVFALVSQKSPGKQVPVHLNE